jgi:Spy/CpxP family protein refolding chaperone
MAAGMIFAQAQPVSPAPKAQQNQAEKRGMEGKRSRRAQARKEMMQALNLTPSQKEQAKTIFGAAREKSQPVRMELRQNREAMSAAVKTNDKAQIEKLSAERGRLVAKLSADRGQAMAKFYQVLTPAQRAKAEQMHARSQARMRQLRNERRGTRPITG